MAARIAKARLVEERRDDAERELRAGRGGKHQHEGQETRTDERFAENARRAARIERRASLGRQRLGQKQHDDRSDDGRGDGDDDEDPAPGCQLDDETAGRRCEHGCKPPGGTKQSRDRRELAAAKAVGRNRIGDDEAGAAADALQEAQREQQRCAGGERTGDAHRDENR